MELKVTQLGTGELECKYRQLVSSYMFINDHALQPMRQRLLNLVYTNFVCTSVVSFHADECF